MVAIVSQQPSRFDVFWGEIAPCEHLVQLYAEEGVFLDSLEGFVAGGIKAGDGVILIATPAHLRALDERLAIRGVDLDFARSRDRYIAVDAEATLSKFMVDGWPDEVRFKQAVHDLIERARRGGRRVRAFGEMVALMWARGHNAATVHLEHLWHKLCQDEAFSLFCAYPRSGFTEEASTSLQAICDAHSKVIAD